MCLLMFVYTLLLYIPMSRLSFFNYNYFSLFPAMCNFKLSFLFFQTFMTLSFLFAKSSQIYISRKRINSKSNILRIMEIIYIALFHTCSKHFYTHYLISGYFRQAVKGIKVSTKPR